MYPAFYLLLFTVFIANAQWEKTTISGGVIVSLVVSDSIIVAGTRQGNVFLSSDNGNTWSQIMSLNSIPQSFGYFRTLSINDNGIYADYLSFGMEYATVVQNYSNDRGTSWSAISYRNPHLYIAARALYDTTLFAAVVTQKSEVYQSTDNGINWSIINYDLSGADVSSIVVSENIVIINLLDSDGIISTDYGKTWNPLNSGLNNTGLNNIEIISIAKSNGTIFAALRNGIIKSKNNGNTWTFDSTAISNVTSFAVKDNMLFAATSKGVFRSAD